MQQSAIFSVQTFAVSSQSMRGVMWKITEKNYWRSKSYTKNFKPL